MMNLDTALLDCRRMSESDRLTVASGHSIQELMEKAGSAVAREIMNRWTSRPVTVLCGPGNNGGDGFVAARRLSEAGWPVRLALLGSRGALKNEVALAAQQWLGQVEPLETGVLKDAQLIVDAVFGAGLTRALDGEVLETLSTASKMGIPLVAVDVPSGLMGDTGEVLGAVEAVLTVTYTRKKPGHLLLPGRDLCGEVVVADIGTPLSVIESVAPNTFENNPKLWISALPKAKSGGNKYTRGHALIYGGYPITGASRMAALGAARAGAGLTTIAVPQTALAIYAGALTSIMVHPLMDAGDFDRMMEDTRFTAFLIGPGTGVGEETRRRAVAILKTKRPVLLDADALTSFQTDPLALDAAIAGPCVLTPHEGEFRRLFDFKGDKLTRARMAAKRSRAILVLKGNDTVIAAPDGRAIINSNAPSTLATAGSGDVLSGIILGLLAQGVDPFFASAAGVWMHGAAADEFGPGLIAEDLPDLLPGVLQKLFRLR